MTDSSNEPADAQLEADIYVSPLQYMAIEVHEVYRELERAGFPESQLVQIVAHMVSDAVFYRGELISDEEDDDEEDEDELPDEQLP